MIQCGRPVSRHLDDGKTLEVTRCCTDGTANACSFLYGRVARIAKEMGYERIITYILISESGASLKAAGWECEKEIAGGGSWDTPARRRHTTAPQCKKQRWMKNLCKEGDESRDCLLYTSGSATCYKRAYRRKLYCPQKNKVSGNAWHVKRGK